ncbi:MAG: hypothetical protein ACI8YO_002392, partial [Gammaproteobacteria bacterium]
KCCGAEIHKYYLDKIKRGVKHAIKKEAVFFLTITVVKSNYIISKE